MRHQEGGYMEGENPKSSFDIREFFSAELRSVMEKQQVSAEKNSFEYLVDLLLRYTESEKFFAKNAEGRLEENILANLYADYLQGDLERKKGALKRLGDVCLFVTGFFADSLNRKIVDMDYYFGMGGTAYWHLSRLHLSGFGKTLYAELAQKFKPFSDVLGEISEKNGVQSNSDLLRLYERWLFTGSERLRDLLSQHGISCPLRLDPKIKQ